MKKYYIFDQNLGNATIGVCIYDKESLNRAKELVKQRFEKELKQYHDDLNKLDEIEKLLQKNGKEQ